MEWIQAILIGISLSAVCGLRVFVPPLFLSIAVQFGWLDLADNFAWLARPEASIALACATILEIVAYSVPWLDNLLDSIATPLAVLAGTFVAATQLFGLTPFTELSPTMTWATAAIAGGGTAAVIQLITVGLRALSSGLTGGIGNFFLSLGEALAAFFFATLALFIPIISTTLLIALSIMLGLWLLRRIRPGGRKLADSPDGIADR